MATTGRVQTRRTLSYSQATYHLQGNAAIAAPAATYAPRKKVAYTKGSGIRRQLPLILILAGLLCAFGFVILVQTARTAQVSKQVSSLRGELLRVRSENEILEKDISALESAGRIQSNATNKLQMVIPSDDDLITVRLPNPRPPSDVLVETPPQRNGWLNALLGLLE